MTAVEAPPNSQPIADTPDELITRQEQFFNRPPRILRSLPNEEINIPAPPQAPTATLPAQLAMVLLPILTALLYIVILIGRGGQNGNFWLSLPIVGISLLSGGLGLYNYLRMRRLRQEALREFENAYNETLDDVRRRLKYLDELQRETRDANDPDSAALLQIVKDRRDDDGIWHPQPRLWERRPTDADFLAVRIGRGDLPTSVVLKPPQANQFVLTPALRRALELAGRYAIVRNVPLTVSLRIRGALGIAGRSGETLALARAMIAQMTIHHSPSELRIAAFWDSLFDSSWGWLSWLPHTRPLNGDDDHRLLARYDDEEVHLKRVLVELVRELQQRAENPESVPMRPHILLLIGDYHSYGVRYDEFAQILRAGRALGFSMLCLVNEMSQVPGECGGYINLDGSPVLALAGIGGGYTPFTPDHVDRATSDELANRLAQIIQLETGGRRELPRNVRLLSLMHVNDQPIDAKNYDPRLLWNDLPAGDISWHPVPIGVSGEGVPLEINLNEGSHGVHGMIAGTTGSGKSEFLLTLLLALTLKHSPDRVNLLLIDFKGGATFKDLEELPHTVGVVTDLEGYMAERALIAINSELDRRKQRLAHAGVPNIREYRKRGFENRTGAGPMPNVLIAIDEFDEMVRDYPDFVLELVRVAKQGRSLGVHLLFATQQPSAIKEGLTRNLTYWIALRVTATDDSKAMVTIPDAAYLTTETPGRGYFRVNKQIVQFQSARITVPYQPPLSGGNLARIDVTGRRVIPSQQNSVERLRDLILDLFKISPLAIDRLVDTFINRYDALERGGMLPYSEVRHKTPELVKHKIGELFADYQAHSGQARQDASTGEVLAEEVARQIESIMSAEQTQDLEISLICRAMINSSSIGYASRRYPVWTQPLSSDLVLPDVLAKVVGAPGWMHAMIGLLDLPVTANQIPCVLDLVGRDGNVLVLGSSNTGKTTLVRTLLLSLARTHTPADLWIYTIDPSGSGCGLVPPVLKDKQDRQRLPHIADALSPNDAPKVERLLIELQGQIEHRRALLREHALDTLAQLRERSVQDRELVIPPVLVVVIDNFAEFGAAHPDAIEQLKVLIRDGRPCGISFVVTGYIWKDVAAIQSNFETRIALRLNDPNDSDAMIGKTFAAKIKPDQRGRAFLRASERPIELQIALPILRQRQPNAAGEGGVLYSDLADELADAIQSICQAHKGISAGLPQPLRSLPARVELADLLKDTPSNLRLGTPIAIDNFTLQPLALDFATSTPHILIAGGPRSGKAELLRTILTGLATRYTADAAQFVLVDYRGRVLQPFEHLPHVRTIELEVPTSPQLNAPKETRPIRLFRNELEIKGLAEHLLNELKARGESNVIAPQIFLVIGNWDLLQASEPTSLNALAPFVLRGLDLGFHMIVSGTEYGNFTSSNLLKMIRTERCAVYLGAVSENSQMLVSNIGMKLSKQALQLDMPPGRGFLLRQGNLHLAQFALASPTLLPDRSDQPSTTRGEP